MKRDQKNKLVNQTKMFGPALNTGFIEVTEIIIFFFFFLLHFCFNGALN